MTSTVYADVLGLVRACALSLLSVAPLAAQAAVITWLAPTPFDSSGSALNQPGRVVSAFSAFGNVTVNDGNATVAFTGLGNMGGAMSFTGYQGQTPAFTSGYNSAINSDFGRALSAFLFDGWQRVSLNNLTPGASYSVQLFALDNRGGGLSASPEYFVDPMGNASAHFALGSDSYVIGTFIADAITESISVRSDYCHGFDCTGQSNGYRQYNEMTNVNAVVLRQQEVPEPSTLLLLAAAGAALWAARRRRCS